MLLIIYASLEHIGKINLSNNTNNKIKMLNY